MNSIHAKCLAVTTKAGRTLICGKSKGHDKSTTRERREHFDPGADERWGATPALDAAAERDCLALALQFALSWDGTGTVHDLHEGIREIVATMPAATAKPLDHFKIVYQAPTADSVQVVADEIRCLDCQSTTGLAGVFEPTLDQLTDMASRHQCLPRIPKES